MELTSERTTHLIRLHLDNDQCIYDEVRRIVAEARLYARPSFFAVEQLGVDEALRHAVRGEVTYALKDMVEDLACGDIDAGATTLLGLDLIGAALGTVDFDELAADYIAIADEEL